MTKKQVVWLITKFFGMWFAYSAIVSVPVLISSIYAYSSLPSPPRFTKAENPANGAQPVSPNPAGIPALNNPASAVKTETESPVEKAKNEALKTLLWNLFSTIFYALIGWYLIRDGRFLFSVLNREGSLDESNEFNDDASFSASRKKEEVVTSLNLSNRKEEITSLNLSDSGAARSDSNVVSAPDVSANAPDNSLNLSDAKVEESREPQAFVTNAEPEISLPDLPLPASADERD
jgi:hypothetical protein